AKVEATQSVMIQRQFTPGTYKINVRDSVKGSPAKFKGGFSFSLKFGGAADAPASEPSAVASSSASTAPKPLPPMPGPAVHPASHTASASPSATPSAKPSAQAKAPPGKGKRK